MSRRVGIFSGSFDPVHKGHISFALEAIRQANLNKVYFLPEAVHRNKTGTTHLAHRLAMLKLAIASHTKLDVLDLPDKQFSVAKTLPRLKQKFPDDEILLLMGADVLEHLPSWPLSKNLLSQTGLIVSTKADMNVAQIKLLIKKLPQAPKELFITTSSTPNVSSRQIRQNLLRGKTATGLLPSVHKYIKQNWLYVAPSSSNSSSK